jgi:general nucleoside transport system permease protein
MKGKFDTLLYNIGAVVVGLVLSGALLLFLKIDPLAVCSKAIGKIFSDEYTIGEILVKATPLIFTSLAFAFTYQANLFNIGAQGQFYAGSLAAVAISLAIGGILPTAVVLLVVFLGSGAAGGAVGGLIGRAKARFNANEFLVSMMSTYVVKALMDYLLRTFLQETKAEYLQTDPIAKTAYLPVIVPGTRIHLGFALAVLAAVGVWVLLYKTPLGFRIRAVGHNRSAAELAGIRTGRIYTVAFLIAGALAGLAGLTEVNGVQHMLLQDFNASIGSFGIGIAILANGSPIGCIFASILFGFLNVMGTTMGRLPGLNIPASIIDLIEGIVMVCVIMSYFFRAAANARSEKRNLRKAGV